MARKEPVVGHAVYWPPLPGLPYIAVTFLPDGSVDARQFEHVRDAEAYTASMAKKLNTKRKER